MTDYRFIAKHPVALDYMGQDYNVVLYRDRAYVQASANNDRGHWSDPKPGSRRFRLALEALRDQSCPGSLTREQMAQCPDTADL